MVAPNDDWANAADLGSAASGTAHGSNVVATTETGEPAPSALGSLPEATLWWKWTCPAIAPAFVAFSTLGSIETVTSGNIMDTVLGVYTGGSLGALSEFASNDDGAPSGYSVNSYVEFVPVAGTTYYLQVGSFPGGTVRGVVWLSWLTGASSGLLPEPSTRCGCLNLVGSEFPDTAVSVAGTAGHRENFGPDQRGTSFWLAGRHPSAPIGFVEEYALPALTLVQRIDLTEPPYLGASGGFADFWGGDGSGGVTYLYGQDIVRRDAGGAYTQLYQYNDFGAVYVGQDPANDRLIIVRRTNNSSPWSHTITALYMDGTNTDLGTFSDTKQNHDYPVCTPDGAVWMIVTDSGGVNRRLARWHPVDGYSRSTHTPFSVLVPRPDGSVWVDLTGIIQSIDGGFTFTDLVACPWSENAPVDGAYGRLAVDELGQVVMANQIPQSSTSVQWDLYLLKVCPRGGWGRRRYGGSGF